MIKKIFLLLILLPSIQIYAELVNRTIESKALEGNLLEPPTQMNIHVYLPPPYSEETRRYPVLYFLSGYGAKAINYSFFHKVLDEEIAKNKTSEMIMVFLDGYNELLGSFYKNSELHGRWEDYIAKDVIEYIDDQFLTLKAPTYRGLAGHSMGGSGAIYIGVRNLKIFGSIYSLSPGVFKPGGFNSSFISENWQAISELNHLKMLLSDKDREDAQEFFLKWLKGIKDKNSALPFLLAYGGAFASQKKAPYSSHPSLSGLKGYVQWENGFGQITDMVISLSKNNVSQPIQIDYGIDDEYAFISEGCAYLKEKVVSSKNVTVLSYDGGHGNKLKARFRDFMLPFFNAQFQMNLE